MAAWKAFVGGKLRVFEEYEVGSYDTEKEAREAAEALGATRHAERMVGAIYVTEPGGRSFRVSSRGWAPGYVLWGVRERAEAQTRTVEDEVLGERYPMEGEQL